jgi:branched-chain amino acid transport system substrate-binding protein
LAGCDTGKSVSSSASDSNGSSTSAAGGRPVSNGAGNTATGDTIKIGLVASLTGPQAPWGKDNLKGSQLAVDEFNEKGGLNGKKVQLVYEDDASKPEEGKTAVEKLIGDENVLGVVGEVASGITLQMAPVCQDKGVPEILVGATKDEITDKGNEIFRVCYKDSFQGAVMANFAYNTLGLHKVALMTDKKLPYSTGLSDAFKATFKKLGGTIVDEQFYEQGQTQFTSQLTNLKAEAPEGVFASGYFSETGPIVKQAAEAGLKVPFFGGDGWDDSQLYQLGGQAIVGDYYCNHYSNGDTSAAVQDFLKRWRAKYGSDPGTAMGALGYDAAALMLDALKRAKGADSKDLRDAIADTTDYKAVTGNITLKGTDGTPLKRAIIVKVTPNGSAFATAIDPSSMKL